MFILMLGLLLATVLLTFKTVSNAQKMLAPALIRVK